MLKLFEAKQIWDSFGIHGSHPHNQIGLDSNPQNLWMPIRKTTSCCAPQVKVEAAMPISGRLQNLRSRPEPTYYYYYYYHYYYNVIIVIIIIIAQIPVRRLAASRLANPGFAELTQI